MTPAQIQLHVTGLRIGHPVIARQILHASLPAVVNGQQTAVGHIGGLIALHVEIVESQHHTGEHLIGRYRPVARFVAELPDGAAVALYQQCGALRRKHLRCVHPVLALLRRRSATDDLFQLVFANSRPV